GPSRLAVKNLEGGILGTEEGVYGENLKQFAKLTKPLPSTILGNGNAWSVDFGDLEVDINGHPGFGKLWKRVFDAYEEYRDLTGEQPPSGKVDVALSP